MFRNRNFLALGATAMLACSTDPDAPTSQTSYTPGAFTIEVDRSLPDATATGAGRAAIYALSATTVSLGAVTFEAGTVTLTEGLTAEFVDAAGMPIAAPNFAAWTEGAGERFGVRVNGFTTANLSAACGASGLVTIMTTASNCNCEVPLQFETTVHCTLDNRADDELALTGMAATGRPCSGTLSDNMRRHLYSYDDMGRITIDDYFIGTVHNHRAIYSYVAAGMPGAGYLNESVEIDVATNRVVERVKHSYDAMGVIAKIATDGGADAPDGAADSEKTFRTMNGRFLSNKGTVLSVDDATHTFTEALTGAHGTGVVAVFARTPSITDVMALPLMEQAQRFHLNSWIATTVEENEETMMDVTTVETSTLTWTGEVVNTWALMFGDESETVTFSATCSN